MTENTTAYVSTDMPTQEIKVTLPETHDHSNDAPVTVTEDNVATVNVHAEEHELEPYRAHFIKEKAKNVTIQGFRKGKAPEHMVARYFKNEARESARDNVLYVKYMKLLQEHKLQPLSSPKVNHMHDENGKLFASITVDVLQPVVLGQYLGLEIEAMPSRSVEESVAKTIAGIKQSYPRLTPTTEGAENGNVLVTDFIVSDGAKELENQKDFKINVGSKFYYQPFEDQLIGLKAGESKEFDIEFPSDYHKEDFRGRKIHFNLTAKEINTVSEYSNEELAKVLGYESEVRMMELITKEVESKFKDEEHLFYENQILGQLLSAHQFKLPRRIIEEESKRIHAERPDMPAEEVELTAERFQRTDLVLHAIYERHPEIHYTQEQFNAKIAELAARANDTVENTIQKLQAAGKLQTYMTYLNNCRVIDFLIEMADKKISTPAAEVVLKGDGAVEVTPAPEKEVTVTTTEEKDNG